MGTKLVYLGALVTLFATVSACTTCHAPQEAAERIGIYDSRAIAVAYCGSAFHEARLKAVRDEMEQARQAGDKKKMAQLENTMREGQRQMHLQGFGTAPVDEILSLIADQTVALKQAKDINALVSKWDKRELAKHSRAAQIDVTSDLVDLFHPSEKQRKSAMAIQETKPISSWRLKLMGACE